MLNSYLDFWQELLGSPYPKSWIQTNPVLSASSWHRVSSEQSMKKKKNMLYGRACGSLAILWPVSKFSTSAIQAYCILLQPEQVRANTRISILPVGRLIKEQLFKGLCHLLHPNSIHIITSFLPAMRDTPSPERGCATPAFWVELEDGGISFGGFRWGMVSSFQMWVAANSCHGWIGPVFDGWNQACQDKLEHAVLCWTWP